MMIQVFPGFEVPVVPEMPNRYPFDKPMMPMGGNTQKNETKLAAMMESDQYITEEKFDGIRYISAGGRLFTRRLAKEDNLPVERTWNAPHLYYFLKEFPSVILDGEGYVMDGDSNNVVSIMGGSSEKAIKKQQERGFINYMVFDMLRDEEGNWMDELPWEERRAKLEVFMEKFVAFVAQSCPPMAEKFVLSRVIRENKAEFLEDMLRQGKEGSMLKDVKGKYIWGKKPANNWVKCKKAMDDDVIVMGYEPATREYNGSEMFKWEYWEDLSGMPVDASVVKAEFADAFRRLSDLAAIKETRDLEDTEIEVIHNIELNIKENYTPVTKYHHMGWIGAVVFGKFREQEVGETVDPTTQITHMTDEGKSYVCTRLGSCSGMDEAMRMKLSDSREEFIGEVIEISAMEKTKDGFYRHPQFVRVRTDKNAFECVVKKK